MHTSTPSPYLAVFYQSDGTAAAYEWLDKPKAQPTGLETVIVDVQASGSTTVGLAKDLGKLTKDQFAARYDGAIVGR